MLMVFHISKSTWSFIVQMNINDRNNSRKSQTAVFPSSFFVGWLGEKRQENDNCQMHEW